MWKRESFARSNLLQDFFPIMEPNKLGKFTECSVGQIVKYKLNNKKRKIWNQFVNLFIVCVIGRRVKNCIL